MFRRKLNIVNEFANITIVGKETNSLDSSDDYMSLNPIPEDMMIILDFGGRGSFPVYTDPNKFVFDLKYFNEPLDIAFMNKAEEVIKIYENCNPREVEAPYCYNVTFVAIMRGGSFAKYKINLGTMIFIVPYNIMRVDEDIETADKYFAFRNEVFAEKWNEKYNYNQRFYYNYFNHIWRINGGSQFSGVISEFKRIQEKETPLNKETALEKIKSYDLALIKDFQKYKEKYYRRGEYAIFSYNEAENIARVYDFITGWKNVDSVINIQEFAVMHFTKEDIEKEIEKYKDESLENKKIMNIVNLEEIDYPEFLRLGKLYQCPEDKRIYNVFPDINKVFKYDGVPPQWTLIDRADFSEKGMKVVEPDKFHEATAELRRLFYEGRERVRKRQ